MKIIKKDTEVTTCDCCGKVDLLYTVKTTEGNFGCVCAPKLLGYTGKQVAKITEALAFANKFGGDEGTVTRRIATEFLRPLTPPKVTKENGVLVVGG